MKNNKQKLAWVFTREFVLNDAIGDQIISHYHA